MLIVALCAALFSSTPEVRPHAADAPVVLTAVAPGAAPVLPAPLRWVLWRILMMDQTTAGIIGAIVGFFVCNVPGALVGFLIGYTLVGKKSDVEEEDRPRRKSKKKKKKKVVEEDEDDD